jgi:hypothetical protein
VIAPPPGDHRFQAHAVGSGGLERQIRHEEITEAVVELASVVGLNR